MNKNINESISLKDLPVQERPRERLEKNGAGYLSNTELLAIIFGSGVKGESVLILAQRLLKHFGSLPAVLNASFNELTAIKGIGNAKACQLLASFEIAKRARIEDSLIEQKRSASLSLSTAKSATKILREYIDDYNIEFFFVILIDIRNHLIGIEKISKGTLTASLVHPRETFAYAIKNKAAKIIIAHNHPSGDHNPSDEDIKVTKRLKDAGTIIGITVVDHLIVTKNSYFSFKEEGMI